MTPVKTWFLLHLSVLFIAPTVSEVVESMTDCGDFLLNNEPPQVPGILEKGQIKNNNRYKAICQTYNKFTGATRKRQRVEPSMMEPQTDNNVRRFVTLYDTENKIPVLSAYKFRGAEEGRPDVPWKMEPQLENMKDDKNMKNSDDNTMYNKQAGDIDYYYSGYDRGHLFPSSYAKTQDDKISTFTLTNAVPQVSSFNQGSWKGMESRVKRIMERSCIDNNGVIEAYVMTGAKPSEKPMKKINNRVNVPSLLWSAFCCYNKKQNRWIAGAYWGYNVPRGPAYLMLTTLAQLYKKLKKGKKTFQAFPEPNCPLKKIPF